MAKFPEIPQLPMLPEVDKTLYNYLVALNLRLKDIVKLLYHLNEINVWRAYHTKHMNLSETDTDDALDDLYTAWELEFNTLAHYAQKAIQDTYSDIINNGRIINGSINASAAIQLSKLAPGAAGDIIFSDSTPKWIELTKGAENTVLKMGPTFPLWGSVVNANIDASAAIATTKLGAGATVQVVNTQTGAVATGTTVIPMDDTIPQNTEGDQYMSLAITPKNTNNKLKIAVVTFITASNAYWMTVALFQDSTANALASGVSLIPSAGAILCIKFTHYMTAGTTSATTFKVRAGVHYSAPTTTTFNGTAGAAYLGGTIASSITITEIAV